MYWAIIDENGDPQNTGILAGEQFDIEIDEETGEIILNGEPTGIFQKDLENIFTPILIEEGDDFITITFGEQSFTLTKYGEDSASLVLGRADFFLRYSGTKQVQLTAEGVEDYYVIAKPDGWKTSLEETTLTVTAPTKEAVEIGAAELEGEILVHATTLAGKCKIAKIDVTAGAGLTMEIDSKGNITIENSFYGEQVSPWGEVSFGFNGIVAGLATPESFLESPEDYVAHYNTYYEAPNYDITYANLYNAVNAGVYEEGVYETDIIKTSANDLYYNFYYEDLAPGSHYVIWIAPMDAEGKAVIEDVIYLEYVHHIWNVEIKSVSHSDIVLSLDVAGADSYVMGLVPESLYNNEYNPMTFYDYMNASMGGPWTGFIQYGAADPLGVTYLGNAVPEEIKVSELNYGDMLNFNEKYMIWVMPMFDYLATIDETQSYPEEGWFVYDFSAYDYETNFLPYVLEATTNDIQPGGDYSATLTEQAPAYTSISVEVGLSEGTESVYYNWYTTDDYATFETDEEVFEDLLMNCMRPITETEILSKKNIKPGQTFVLATVAIGADGKYGDVVAETFSTPEVPYDGNIKVEFVSITENGNTYEVVFNVTGADYVAGYNITDSGNFNDTFINNVLSLSKNCQHAAVTDGKATLTFTKSTYKKDYFFAGYKVKDNLVTAISTPAAINIEASLDSAE